MTTLENRIPPPFVTIIFAVAMWAASLMSPPVVLNNLVHYGLTALFFGLGALFGAPAIRAFVRAKTTIDPVHIDRASTVVTTGIYGISRNPMYVAMTCLLLSWAAYLANPWGLFGPLLFVLFITRFQIVPEERAMTARFGVAFADYRGSVRRWV